MPLNSAGISFLSPARDGSSVRDHLKNPSLAIDNLISVALFCAVFQVYRAKFE